MEAAEATDGVCSGAVAASEECHGNARRRQVATQEESQNDSCYILLHFKSHGDVVRFFADSREVPSGPG